MAETQVNYKETLNLPQTDFPMKANLPAREPEMLARWDSTGLYEKIMAARAGAPLFVLHDGPPFANGDVHIGHVLNKTLKDVVVKYKAMSGFCAPYVPGWDCHGLPIEFKVTQEMRKAGNTTADAATIRQACDAYARKYIDIQRTQFKRLGVLGDWEHPYLTLNKEYEADELRLFADIVEQGFVYRGKKPIYWCATCRTALAEAEVEYADHVSPSVYVKFPVKGREKEFAVIWTTTPWTLPANLAIAVKPDLTYVRVKAPNGETWILAEGLVERVAAASGVELVVQQKVAIEELEKLVTRHPFVERDSPVVLSPYVTLEQGTGLVHTAPGHGAEDYEIGQKYGLETLAPVDDGGVFTKEAGQFAGQFVFKANKSIVEHLQAIGALAGYTEVTHSYPHCWRCKNPIIFRAMEQWFIALDHLNLRQRALEEVRKVKWVPTWGENRIAGTVAQRPDWCISRQRAWGVPIPAFYDAQGQPILDAQIVRNAADLVEKHGSNVWFEKSGAELWSALKPKDWKGAEAVTKSHDTLDVWIDSGSSSRAVLMRRPELKHALTDANHPAWQADLYMEGSDQHRGWFQSSLLLSVAGNGVAPFKAVATHGFLVVQIAETGKKQKVSKSAGKPANSEEYVKRYGADVLRLWVVSEDYQGDVPLSDEIFDRVSETYRKVRNTLRILLANLYDFVPTKHAVPHGKLAEIDRWLLSRLQALVADLTEAYQNLEFHRVYHLVNAFCAVEISSFYVDVMKDPLYTLAPNSAERRSAQTAIFETVATLAKVLAPIVPFTADEVWNCLPGRETESVHLAKFPVVDAERRDAELEARWERLLEVRRVASLELEKARQGKTIGKSLEAQVEIEANNDATREMLEKLGSVLETVLIVSQVRVARSTGGELRVKVSPASGSKCVRCWRWTEDVGADAAHPELCGRCTEVVKQRA
jgi:isoleucyl-tRNA synthetase